MAMFDTSSQHPFGFSSYPEKIRVTMRGKAGKKGQIVAFDLHSADGATEATSEGGGTFGGKTSAPANVIEATSQSGHFGALAATGLQHSLMAVLTADVADDGETYAVIRGPVDGLCVGTVSAGRVFYNGATTTGALQGMFRQVTSAAGRGKKIIGISRERSHSASSASGLTTTKMFFNGIEGFGICPTSGGGI